MIDQLRRKVYRYYFIPPDDESKEEPLIVCPKCKADLTAAKSIKAVLTGDKAVVYLTRLDCGVLQDTTVLNILKYGKEEVTCTHCSCSLADLDCVYEEELVI